jgi:DNA-binding NarL/FixJ family response regulator
MMAPSLKILLVEDEPLWQEGIKALLGIEPDWQVVSVCDNFDSALVSFEKDSPDLVLLDWKIKGDKDGLAVGTALTDKGFPAEKIILVTGSHPSVIPENDYHYVPKQSIGNELVNTIKNVTKV